MIEGEHFTFDMIREDLSGSSSIKAPVGRLNDPNISQEDKDLCLAIVLQQQENVRALVSTKKKVESARKADLLRTGRSVYAKKNNNMAKTFGNRLFSVILRHACSSSHYSSRSTCYDIGTDSLIEIIGINSLLEEPPEEVRECDCNDSMCSDLELELQKIKNSLEAAEKLKKTEKRIREAQKKRTARSGMLGKWMNQ